MGDTRKIVRLSPLPTVNLKEIVLPSGGLFLDTPSLCVRHFNRGASCREHYAGLLHGAAQGQFVQCPFGFSSFSFHAEQGAIAITAFVPHPRLGGEAERRLAKQYPAHRVSSETVRKTARAISDTARELKALERDALNNHSAALHELRKLNRAVKQTAERLCRNGSPEDPEAADPSLVRIWKTADLMSNQFDVVELLANERLAALPLNASVEIYKLFDKCVRIYRASSDPRRILLTAPAGYSPRIRACDKTLPIIPTVLVENAIRYSLKGSDVTVSLRPEGPNCLVEVSNLTALNAALTERVFERGVRVSPDSEGSGNGLYLAQLVAAQHGAQIRLTVDTVAKDRMKCAFALAFREV
jgi:signal transduction histidine kinase